MIDWTIRHLQLLGVVAVILACLGALVATTKELREWKEKTKRARAVAGLEIICLWVALAVGILMSQATDKSSEKLEAEMGELRSRNRIIQAISADVTIDFETPPMPKDDRGASTGKRSAIIFVGTNSAKYRFLTDYSWSDQQIAPTTHRVYFTYGPEFPTEILGKNLNALTAIEHLVADYSGFFSSTQQALVTLSLVVNGVEVVTHPVAADINVLKGGQVMVRVGHVFKGIPEVYEAKLAKQTVK